MKVIAHTIEHNYGDTFRLYYLTDTHVGARACDEQLLRRDIEVIRSDPHAYWIGGGDYIDAIMEVEDKRFRLTTVAQWVYDEISTGNEDLISIQGDHFCKLIAPIAHKCLGLVEGNHEGHASDKYRHRVYWDMVQSIARLGGHKWQDLMLGRNGFVTLNFRRMSGGKRQRSWSKTIYCHHGYGGGGTVGGAVNKLNKAMQLFEADMVLFGHLHIEATNPVRITRAAGRSIKYVDRFGFFVPSYLGAHIVPSNPGQGRPVDTYAEKKGYAPKRLGTFPIVLAPDNDNIEYYKGVQPGLDKITALKPYWDKVGIKAA